MSVGQEPCNDCGSPYRAGFRKRLLRCSVSPPEVMLCPACYAKRDADCAPDAGSTNPEDIDFGDPGTPIPMFGSARTMALRDSSHAYHKLGDIGRPATGQTEFIFVRAEKPGFLIGNFCEGYGFLNVHFPREACREVTADEEAFLSRHRIVVV
jgi:hypothetical protein